MGYIVLNGRMFTEAVLAYYNIIIFCPSIWLDWEKDVESSHDIRP